MVDSDSLVQRCRFETGRLLIKNWRSCISATWNETEFAKVVIEILSKKVTKSLPEGWQGISSIEQAKDWINQRSEESAFLIVKSKPAMDVIGFLFLYKGHQPAEIIDLRIGYLLSESVWGYGLGSELIGGLVDWCNIQTDIGSISGGVEKDNVGSIKVLEKNGFVVVESDNQDKSMVFMEFRLNHLYQGT
jgi:RimJ/RimL family protein N-acetyltransferase